MHVCYGYQFLPLYLRLDFGIVPKCAVFVVIFPVYLDLLVDKEIMNK